MVSNDLSPAESSIAQVQTGGDAQKLPEDILILHNWQTADFNTASASIAADQTALYNEIRLW